MSEGDLYQLQREADHELRAPGRTLWYCKRIELEDEFDVGEDEYTDQDSNGREPCWGSKANLIASRTTRGLHAPVLDIDFEARLIPSRTEGHYHLYLDREIPWWKYRILLWALKVAGIIEPGYYRASVERKMTMCRWRIFSHFDAIDQFQMQRVKLHELSQKLSR